MLSSIGYFTMLILLLLPLWGCAGHPFNSFVNRHAQTVSQRADEFHSQRQQMVQEQLQARGIKNPTVLNAMSKVPRHQFVEPAFVRVAYEDFPLPIAHEQTISQPYIVAYMTEAADISPTEKVLEIGTGSGYQAAVLGEIAKTVYSIEIIPELAASARQRLSNLGYENVQVKTGDGYQGWAENAPYDAILVTAAPDHIPEPLVQQLATNGRMVIPVGTRFQEMMLITKTQQGVLKETTIPVQFVPLTRASP
jgi:protein-L-isoaspartate(D-aspartate) O-methyltransferase